MSLPSPPHDDEEGRWRAERFATSSLVSDLRFALLDDELCDVTLRGSDGETVPAIRSILAARSPVFRRMLYGPFREGKRGDGGHVVDLGFDSNVVRLVVEFCCTADVESTARRLPPRCRTEGGGGGGTEWSGVCGAGGGGACRDMGRQSLSSSTSRGEFGGNANKCCNVEAESILRDLVGLVVAGNFYSIPGLDSCVLRIIFDSVRRWKPLACVVFDESVRRGQAAASVGLIALSVIRRVPELVLLTYPEGRGGCGTLGPDAVAAIVDDVKVQCDEAAMFRFLKKWAEWKAEGDGEKDGMGGDGLANVSSPLAPCSRKRRREESDDNNDSGPHNKTNICAAADSDLDRISTARQIACGLNLSKIAPRVLADLVSPSGLVSQDRLLEAYRAQALCAAEGADISCHFSQFRSKRTRIALVLGAGSEGVNGAYAQDNPHQFSKAGRWRGADVTYLLSKLGSRWYIWIPSHSICFYCCLRWDRGMPPVWKTSGGPETPGDGTGGEGGRGGGGVGVGIGEKDSDDCGGDGEEDIDGDDSVGDCLHMGIEPAPTLVWCR